MTNDKALEVNRRVAVALGSTVTYHKPQWSSAEGWKLRQPAKLVPGQEDRTPYPCWQEDGLYGHEDYAWSMVHDYIRDPRAADLVRQEARRRGWKLVICDMPPSQPSQPQWGFDVTIRGDDIQFGSRSYYGNVSPHHSLCLAFLEAHEAAKAQGGESK